MIKSVIIKVKLKWKKEVIKLDNSDYFSDLFYNRETFLKNSDKSALSSLVSAGKSVKILLGPPQGTIGDLRDQLNILKIIIKAETKSQEFNIITGERLYQMEEIIKKLGPQIGGGGLYYLVKGKVTVPSNTSYSSSIIEGFLAFPEEKELNLSEHVPFLSEKISGKFPLIDTLKNNSILEDKIKWLNIFTKKTKEQFSSASAIGDSKTLVKERKNILEHIAIFENILPEINLPKLYNISENLYIYLQKLKKAAEVNFFSICFNCGEKNNPERKYCIKCHSIMASECEYVNPSSRGEEGEEKDRKGAIISYNLQKIIKALEDFNKNKNKEQYIKIIAELDMKFKIIKKELKKIENELKNIKGNRFLQMCSNILKKNIEKITRSISLLKEGEKISTVKGLDLLIESFNDLYFIQIAGEEGEKVL